MNNSFCSLPWLHLASHPAGYVTLCCQSETLGLKSAAHVRTDESVWDGKPYFYNLKQHSLALDIYNSSSFCKTRAQMLSGERPTECNACWKAEANGEKSKRQLENERWGYTAADAQKITNADGSLTKVEFKFIELRLGNTCNARCMTCNPLSSSNWRHDYLALSADYDYIRGRYHDMSRDSMQTWEGANTFELDWYRNTHFWDELRLHTHSLELIYINGGEPTLIKEHWEFLDYLVAADLAKNITLWYNINMTQVPKQAAIWKHFKKVMTSASIDAVDEQLEIIRYPIKQAQVDESMQRLQELGVEISITATVSALNFFYLDTLLERYPSTYIHANFVDDPSYYSLAVIPQQARDKYLEQQRPQTDWQHDFWQRIKARSNNTQYDETLAQQMLDVTASLDIMRNTSSRSTLSRLFSNYE